MCSRDRTPKCKAKGNINKMLPSVGDTCCQPHCDFCQAVNFQINIGKVQLQLTKLRGSVKFNRHQDILIIMCCIILN
jgi:hypothetical protein